MGRVLGWRELNPYQRVGGWFGSLEAVEEYVSTLSFDCFVSDKCDPGAQRSWFAVPASQVEE